MKLVSFSTADSSVQTGILLEPGAATEGLDIMVLEWWDITHDDFAEYAAQTPAGHPTMLDIISSGLWSTDVNDLMMKTHQFCRSSDVKIQAPLSNPPRVFAIGLNYREHAIESKMALPKTPVVFFKMTTCIIGPGENIVLPRNSSQPDYEAELAFVIGKGGYRIPANECMSHVYGYTIVNDVSARDVQLANSQWSMGKSFPTFCPMGPAIVTADEIADPHSLAISLSIDGEVMQNSNTNELVFTVPALIEFISSITPLLPGDIVSTGTPSGVGMGRTPQRWLKPGENVTVTVEGLGSLTNPTVAE